MRHDSGVRDGGVRDGGVPEDDRSGAAPVQSVDRALQVLELIGRMGAAGVTELAAELGVHKSTVSRIIASLETRDFVEQLTERGKYRLGFAVVRLAGSTAAQIDLAKQGQDICDAVAHEVGETTNIAVIDGDLAINLVEAGGASSVALRSWVGQPCPAHATSSGKVLLAGLGSDQVRSRYRDPLPRYTETTITGIEALLGELDKIEDRGWGMAEEELEVGLVAVAAPVRDYSGKVIAALSVSGPRYRIDPADSGALVERVQIAAATLSERFGYHP